MAKGQKFIIVDTYTYGLLQRAIDEGKAHTIDDAVLHGISSYLGIRYKSKQERKLEQDLARVIELGESVKKGE